MAQILVYLCNQGWISGFKPRNTGSWVRRFSPALFGVSIGLGPPPLSAGFSDLGFGTDALSNASEGDWGCMSLEEMPWQKMSLEEVAVEEDQAVSMNALCHEYCHARGCRKYKLLIE